MIKAVLFDNDGVISDTELDRLKHLKRLAEERGYTGIDEKKHLKYLIGKRSEGLLRYVFGEKMDEKTMAEIIHQRRKECRESPERYIKLVDGVKELYEKLSKNYELSGV